MSGGVRITKPMRRELEEIRRLRAVFNEMVAPVYLEEVDDSYIILSALGTVRGRLQQSIARLVHPSAEQPDEEDAHEADHDS